MARYLLLSILLISCSTSNQYVTTRYLENGNTMVEVPYKKYVYLYQIEGYQVLNEGEKQEQIKIVRGYLESRD